LFGNMRLYGVRDAVLLSRAIPYRREDEGKDEMRISGVRDGAAKIEATVTIRSPTGPLTHKPDCILGFTQHLKTKGRI
jgi:hypothetical protein